MNRLGRVPRGADLLKEQIREKQKKKIHINNSNFELALLVALQNALILNILVRPDKGVKD